MQETEETALSGPTGTKREDRRNKGTKDKQGNGWKDYQATWRSIPEDGHLQRDKAFSAFLHDARY
jgi:hypothetical protein